MNAKLEAEAKVQTEAHFEAEAKAQMEAHLKAKFEGKAEAMAQKEVSWGTLREEHT